MERVLESINRNHGVVGSAILDNEGAVIVSDFREKIQADKLLRYVALVESSCDRAVGSGGRGTLCRITVDGSAGRLLIYGLQEGCLVVFAEKSANVGMLRLSVERAVSQAQNTPVDRAA